MQQMPNTRLQQVLDLRLQLARDPVLPGADDQSFSVETPLRPYSIAYRRASPFFTYGLFKQSPMWQVLNLRLAQNLQQTIYVVASAWFR